MARVYSPNESHSCDFGVVFYNGCAVVPDANTALLADLTAKGYTVVTGSDSFGAFGKLTKTELIAIASGMGLTTTDKTKAQLIALIETFTDAGILPVITDVASSGLTDLVLTLSEALYDSGSAVEDETDLKAKFTGTGVTITSAIYDADAKTITFVIADATENDTITYTGDSLTDSAGGILGNLSYTAGESAWFATA